MNLRTFKELVGTGKIFTVKFIKRTTGELRTMNCRTGVKKHLKGGEKKFKDSNKNLLTVYDLQKKGYRSIPVESIQEIVVEGETITLS